MAAFISSGVALRSNSGSSMPLATMVITPSIGVCIPLLLSSFLLSLLPKPNYEFDYTASDCSSRISSSVIY